MVFDKIGRSLGRGASRISGGEREVIKWPEELDPESYIAWKYPKDEIDAGSVVIVNESQRVVFLRDGKILGVLGPGRHVLDTQNVPFLKGLVEGLYGESIFKASIVFVNLLQYESRFGDRAFIDWVGVHLLFNGTYYFTVDENRIELFYTRFMGVQSEVTKDDVRRKINPFIVSTMIDAFGEYASEQARAGRMVQNVSDFLAMLGEFSEYVKAKVAQKVNEMYGLKLSEITVKIDISDEDKALLQMSGPRAFAAMYQREWQGRERIAESLSKAQGAAAFAPFFIMPWMTQPPQPPQPQQGQQMTPPVRPQQQQPQQYPQGYYYPPQQYPAYPQGQMPPQYPYQQQPQQPQQGQQARPPQAPQQPPGQPYYPAQPYPYPYPYPYQQPYQPQPYPQPAPQQARPRCPYCGREIPPLSPVCPYCARQLKWCPDGRPVKVESGEC